MTLQGRCCSPCSCDVQVELAETNREAVDALVESHGRSIQVGGPKLQQSKCTYEVSKSENPRSIGHHGNPSLVSVRPAFEDAFYSALVLVRNDEAFGSFVDF